MEKALLILDLDETLLYGTKSALEYSADFNVGAYFIYLRPHCLEFLSTMSKHYKLAIWSSAGQLYVQEISEYFKKLNFSFEFIWSRTRATYRRSKFSEHNYLNSEATHQFYVKRLSKVKKLGFSIERILIVDDTPHKSSDNYGNAIYPIMFEGDLNDIELKKLEAYLVSIKDVKNYRTLEKRFWRNQII